ncbi:hypothetical protein FOZ63_011339, partial [Perkinsus olseni]
VCLRFATTRVKYFKTALRPKILRLFTAAIEASFELPSEDILAKDSFQLNLVRFYAVLCSFEALVPQKLIHADLHARWMPKVLSDTSSDDFTVELVSGLVWTLPKESAEIEETVSALEENLRSTSARAYLPEGVSLRWLALTLFLDEYHNIKVGKDAVMRALPELTSEESFPRVGWLVAALMERYQIESADVNAIISKLECSETPLLEKVHLVQVLAAISTFLQLPRALAKILFRLRPRSTSDRSHTYALGICETFSWRAK